MKDHLDNLSGGISIEVIYSAHLNEDAEVGINSENTNVVSLQYSNDPNVTPPDPGENPPPPDGETESDTVWVFTYEIPNTKVDANKAPLSGAGFRLYSDEACSTEVALIYDADLGAYRPIDDDATPAEVPGEMFSAATTGKFNIVGLDVGTYYLKETTTPAGYNTCPVIELKIHASKFVDSETKQEVEASGPVENTSGTGADAKIKLTVDGAEAEVNSVVNKPGTVLPVTGGIGTTIFYILGAVLVLGAIVLLITKKRMSSQA